MRIAVDLGRCQGNGACQVAAPEVFQVGEDGALDVLQHEPGPELRPAVRRAARRCPTQAITVQA